MTDGADTGITASSRLTGAVMQKGEPMDDTIRRAAALATVEKMYKICEGNLSDYHDLLVACFTDLPSAQQERKKGKWIYHSEIGWGDTWLCDQCGEKTTSTVMGKPRANYCPMCGADMRGKQDE